jgi:hypothetical protein
LTGLAKHLEKRSALAAKEEGRILFRATNPCQRSALSISTLVPCDEKKLQLHLSPIKPQLTAFRATSKEIPETLSNWIPRIH